MLGVGGDEEAQVCLVARERFMFSQCLIVGGVYSEVVLQKQEEEAQC